jgi:hypothetical protein
MNRTEVVVEGEGGKVGQLGQNEKSTLSINALYDGRKLKAIAVLYVESSRSGRWGQNKLSITPSGSHVALCSGGYTCACSRCDNSGVAVDSQGQIAEKQFQKN